MGFKKNSKVNATFNMSSLTDIIFLLLIFFMLTSSLVTPNALNLQLPGSKNFPTTPPSKSKTDNLKINSNDTYTLNGTKVSIKGVEKHFDQLQKRQGKKASIIVKPHGNASNDAVVAVLDAAYRYGINPTLLEP